MVDFEKNDNGKLALGNFMDVSDYEYFAINNDAGVEQ